MCHCVQPNPSPQYLTVSLCASQPKPSVFDCVSLCSTSPQCLTVCHCVQPIPSPQCLTVCHSVQFNPSPQYLTVCHCVQDKPSPQCLTVCHCVQPKPSPQCLTVSYCVQPMPSPQCLTVSYCVQDKPPGTLVIKLIANDSDTGRNGLVEYTLVQRQDPKNLQTFHLNSSTGELTTRVQLDREAHSEYKVSWQCILLLLRGFPVSVFVPRDEVLRMQKWKSSP